MYSIMSSINSDKVLFLLCQFGFLLFLFSSLIALARTFKTMLCNNSESGHLCLIPDFRVNAFKFWPLRIMCCRLFIYGLYYGNAGSLFAHFVDSFYHKWVLNFVRSFFYIYWDDHMVFILHFLNRVYHTNWFPYIGGSLHP